MTLHLLWECVHEQKVWKALLTWLNRKLRINQEITVQQVIFCNAEGAHRDLINAVILIAKQHIYTHKFENMPLDFVGTMSKIIYYFKIEKKTIAYKNNKQKAFNKKMGKFIQL